jgi:hypothetical protein
LSNPEQFSKHGEERFVYRLLPLAVNEFPKKQANNQTPSHLIPPSLPVCTTVAASASDISGSADSGHDLGFSYAYRRCSAEQGLDIQQIASRSMHMGV